MIMIYLYLNIFICRWNLNGPLKQAYYKNLLHQKNSENV